MHVFRVFGAYNEALEGELRRLGAAQPVPQSISHSNRVTPRPVDRRIVVLTDNRRVDPVRAEFCDAGFYNVLRLRGSAAAAPGKQEQATDTERGEDRGSACGHARSFAGAWRAGIRCNPRAAPWHPRRDVSRPWTSAARGASQPYAHPVCGRYTNTAGIAELSERLRVPIHTAEGTRRYNIAPTEQVLAIVAPRGEPEARLLRWGLIPPWADDLKVGSKYINARMETITQRAPYRTLIGRASRRALQVADGYFEWLAPEHPRRGEPRQPFHFQLDGGEVFAFAAVWTPAKVGGEWVHSVALLTCDASPNPVAAAIHDRMPVILADEDSRRAWLDQRLDAQDALALCGPLPASRLTARPANPALNRPDPEAEGPELLVAPGATA
jgi:putative SOS response-associated peptidase YedK